MYVYFRLAVSSHPDQYGANVNAAVRSQQSSEQSAGQYPAPQQRPPRRQASHTLTLQSVQSITYLFYFLVHVLSNSYSFHHSSYGIVLAFQVLWHMQILDFFSPMTLLVARMTLSGMWIVSGFSLKRDFFLTHVSWLLVLPSAPHHVKKLGLFLGMYLYINYVFVPIKYIQQIQLNLQFCNLLVVLSRPVSCRMHPISARTLYMLTLQTHGHVEMRQR